MRRGSARRGRIWDKEEAQAVSLALHRISTTAHAARQLPRPRVSTPSSSLPINSETQVQPRTRKRAQAPRERTRPPRAAANSKTGTESRFQPPTPTKTKTFHCLPTPSPSSVDSFEPQIPSPAQRKARPPYGLPPLCGSSSFISLELESPVQSPTRKETQAPEGLPQPRKSSTTSGSSSYVVVDSQAQSPTWRTIFQKKASCFGAALAARLLQGKTTSVLRDLDVGTLNVRALRSKSPLQLRNDLVHVFETPQLKAQALDLRHTEAARFNELIHRCLTALPEDEPAQIPILRLLQDVCSESGELPSSYWLKRVNINWRQCIGKGGEALIFQGFFHDQEVVVRQVHKPDGRGWGTEAGQEALKYIRREIITHAQLRHPNVIAFLGVFRDDDNDGAPMIVLPFMENGSAMDYLKQLSAAELRNSSSSILLGVAGALAYLHGKNPPVYHGDLHPENILIDAKGKAVLCDFGFSRIRHETTRTHTLIREGGRFRYLAPELSSGPFKFRTSQASDIYSLAMTFLTLLTLALPFSEINREFEAARAAEQGIRPQRPKKMNLMPAEENPMWDLLGHMWRHDPEKRVDAFSVDDQLKAVFFHRSLWSTS